MIIIYSSEIGICSARPNGPLTMKHKLTTIIMALVGIGAAFSAQTYTATVTFSFLENGSNVNLGNTSTFTEGGLSLTASGFLTSGGATALFAKSTGPIGGAGETGLGLARDPSGDNEITTDDFIQLTVPTTPTSTFNLALLSSVQQGEQALVYFTTTSGSLTGATLIGTITNADGSVTIPNSDQTGFIDITAGSANVLLESATFTSNRTTVPDSGTTAVLLGCALSGLGVVRRWLKR